MNYPRISTPQSPAEPGARPGIAIGTQLGAINFAPE